MENPLTECFFNKIVFSLLRHDYAAVLKKFLEPRHIRIAEVSHFGAWNKARRPLFKNSPLDFDENESIERIA